MKTRTGLAVVALLAVLTSARAEVKGPPIKDGAGMYSKEAIARATQLISQVRETWDIDVYVETMKELPEKQRREFKELKGASPAKIAQWWKEFAQSRADQLGVNGLYILLSKEPPHTVVIGWPAWREQEHITSTWKRKMLKQEIGVPRGSKPDKALVQALEKYREAVGEPIPPPPLSALHALVVIGCLLGLWAVLALVRMRTAARLAAGQPVLPLYLPAVQASLFGVPAGFWVTDRLFKVEQESRAVVQAPPAPEPEEPPPAEGADPTEGIPP